MCLAQAEHPSYPSGVGGLAPGPPRDGERNQDTSSVGTWGGRHLPLIDPVWPVVEGLASPAQEQAKSRGSGLDSRSQVLVGSTCVTLASCYLSFPCKLG